ncbi:hypothetical protein BJY00DRAFT_319472 [Aspergillus carlsbadensis]|nr:hypothetical protein BJY00DRAFT_319472 [Aspergillus carlsbadensis]
MAFCDEVHILLPILHIPALRARYTVVQELLAAAGPTSASYNSNDQQQKDLIAQVLICLALGKYAECLQVEGVKRVCAPGWNFYSAATSVLGDLLHPCSSDPILRLQTLTLMIGYLYGLGALVKAGKLLALATRELYCHGFNRVSVLDALPVFKDEMVRRLWWGVYIVDTQIAVDGGYPTVVNENNADIGLPRALSEDWMSSHEQDTRTAQSLDLEIEGEVKANSSAHVRFLCAMVRYTGALRTVWRAIYRARMLHEQHGPTVTEYLEDLILVTQRGLDAEYAFPPIQPPDSPATHEQLSLMKQKMLLHVVSPLQLPSMGAWLMITLKLLSVRLLISTSMPSGEAAHQTHVSHAAERTLACFHLAYAIIKILTPLITERAALRYMFIPSLVWAVRLSLEMISDHVHLQKLYGDSLILAVKTLRRCSRRSWLPKKVAEDVMKSCR